MFSPECNVQSECLVCSKAVVLEYSAGRRRTQQAHQTSLYKPELITVCANSCFLSSSSFGRKIIPVQQLDFCPHCVRSCSIDSHLDSLLYALENGQKRTFLHVAWHFLQSRNRISKNKILTLEKYANIVFRLCRH